MDSKLFPQTYPPDAHAPVRAGTVIRDTWRYLRRPDGVAIGKFTDAEGSECLCEVLLSYEQVRDAAGLAAPSPVDPGQPAVDAGSGDTAEPPAA